jgi:hypothetical protein
LRKRLLGHPSSTGDEDGPTAPVQLQLIYPDRDGDAPTGHGLAEKLAVLRDLGLIITCSSASAVASAGAMLALLAEHGAEQVMTSKTRRCCRQGS